MAFKLASRTFGASAAIEYLLGTDDEAYILGEALTLSSGRLTVATGESIPLFICQKTQAAETTAVTPIPVMRVMPNQEYGTTFSTTPSGVVLGSIVDHFSRWAGGHGDRHRRCFPGVRNGRNGRWFGGARVFPSGVCAPGRYPR